MAANRAAVNHVLPIVGQAQIDQRLQQGIPDALLRLAPEQDVDRIPFAVTFVHVAPGASDPRHVHHSIEKSPVVPGRPSPAASLRWQQRSDRFPFRT